MANRTILHRRAESKILFFLLFSRNKGVLLPLHRSTNLISTTVTLSCHFKFRNLDPRPLYFIFSPMSTVDQSTGMIPPHNIFQPFLKKNFSLLSTTICSYEKKLDLQSLLLELLLQLVDIVVLII